MKDYSSYLDYVWYYRPFLNGKRPKAVERQIERYWKETDKEKRKIIYQYISLERIVEKEWHSYFNF